MDLIATQKFSYIKQRKFNNFHHLDANRRTSVVIGNDVWIGARATILESVTIGDGAVIADGAVITKNAPPYTIVGGVLSKVIKYRFDEYALLKCWEKDKEWLKSRVDDLMM